VPDSRWSLAFGLWLSAVSSFTTNLKPYFECAQLSYNQHFTSLVVRRA